MDQKHIRNVNQETPNVLPLPMLPPNGRGSSNENHVPNGQGQRVDSNAEMDPKMIKRVAAGREYSQKYRIKQMQYVAKLEEQIKTLEAEVAINIPRIKYADAQNTLMRLENGSMKEKLSALTGSLMMKQAEYQELKTEKEVLKHLALMQQSSQYDQSSTQTRHYSNPMMNMSMDQPGFNQFAGAAAAAAPPSNPIMQNRNLGNKFVHDVNNRDDQNPM